MRPGQTEVRDGTTTRCNSDSVWPRSNLARLDAPRHPARLVGLRPWCGGAVARRLAHRAESALRKGPEGYRHLSAPSVLHVSVTPLQPCHRFLRPIARNRLASNATLRCSRKIGVGVSPSRSARYDDLEGWGSKARPSFGANQKRQPGWNPLQELFARSPCKNFWRAFP